LIECVIISNIRRPHSALIEYQNNFISEGDALHGGVKVVMESTKLLANHSARPNKASAQL
jgi:hypothetical protein